MSATETIRQLLDERGVEHIDYEDSATWWSNGDVECSYIQSMSDGLGQLCFMATPEQAIEVTLGRETCKAKLYKPEYGFSDCTVCECGETNDISAVYCNRCGRRIEVECREAM